MNFFFAVVLLVLALLLVVVRKTYYSLPLKELKRKAEHQDPFASAIYHAVAYGNSLRSLLWIVIGFLSAASIILFARALPVWVSLIIVGPLLWIVFSWIPASRVTKFGTWITKHVTPVIVSILNWLHPVLNRGADAVEKRYKTVKHTGLFERDDLVELIEKQQKQVDNRLSPEELEIARRALTFGDFTVADILTPGKEIKTVMADDIVGPILIDELHQSGQSLVLVRESKKGPVIGSLEFHQLNLHSKGHVRDVMNKTVYYLHENDTLSEALHAFFSTNHPVFVVVNSFEEYLGVVTVENILRQLLGHLPGDEFDQYANLEAVAARHTHAKKPVEVDAEIDMENEELIETEPTEPDETPVKSDDEVVE
jgi:CBS domain containing-hemolysin-like protein